MNTSAVSTLSSSWPGLWEQLRDELRRRHYAPATLRLHRQVLRRFSRFSYTSPAGVTPAMIKAYLAKLAFDRTSWSWKAANICVLRMVFDKLGGRSLTTSLQIPRRSFRLPEILDESEARAVLRAGTSLRDRLLLGLLYGAGLKPGEVCALRWSDLSPDAATLRLPFPPPHRPCTFAPAPPFPATTHPGTHTPTLGVSPTRNEESGTMNSLPARLLPIPLDLQPVLREGLLRCASGDPVFPGSVPGSHLSNRTLERLVRAAGRRAGVIKPVSAMTLRHSYAVHLLDRGISIPDLRERLGHRSVDTTLIYEGCRLPKDTVSPLDSLNEPTPIPACPPKALQSGEPCQNTAPLFDKPLDATPLIVPFPSDPALPLLDRAAEFCQAMKARLTARFLAVRAFVSGRPNTAGPP